MCASVPSSVAMRAFSAVSSARVSLRIECSASLSAACCIDPMPLNTSSSSAIVEWSVGACRVSATVVGYPRATPPRCTISASLYGLLSSVIPLRRHERLERCALLLSATLP